MAAARHVVSHLLELVEHELGGGVVGVFLLVELVVQVHVHEDLARLAHRELLVDQIAVVQEPKGSARRAPNVSRSSRETTFSRMAITF